MNQHFSDGYRNLAAGITRGKSKSLQGTYSPLTFDDASLINMYRGSMFAKKVVDIPADDATRRWRSWNADSKDISEIEKAERSLNLVSYTRRAIKLARLLGNSVIYMSVEGQGDPHEVMRAELVKKGQLRRLSVISRNRLTPSAIDEDPDSPYYGSAESYKMKQGGQVIHASRMVILKGEEILDPQDSLMRANNRWDSESVLQSIYENLMANEGALTSVFEMLYEAKVDVYKIPDLMNKLAMDPDFENVLIERFRLAQAIKSVNNGLVIDSEEEHDSKQLNFGGVSSLVEQVFMLISCAAEIPMTRLFGRSPAGMNATGESDIRLYYDQIANVQANEISPALQAIDQVMLRSVFGTYDESMFPTWRPLWAPTDLEKADLGKRLAEIGKALVDGHMVSEEIVGKAITNSLIEYEVLPGLEAAINEAGGDVIEETNEIETFSAMVKKRAIPVEQPIAQIAADATPRTLYIRRDVVNNQEVYDHYRSQGFDGEFVEDLHVTVTHSKELVDWMQMPEPWESELKLPAGGPRLHEALGESEPLAQVLLIRSSELSYRWSMMKEAGARWDYPDYQPHITITYDGDLSQYEPYKGPITLGPEVWEEVDEDGKARVVGKETKQ